MDEAHSKLPQQIDVRAEAGVQVEVDHLRGVAYMHVDGYTCARVNYRGVPISVEIKRKVGDQRDWFHPQSTSPIEIHVEEVVDISKAAKAITGMIMAERFLSGKEITLNLTGQEVDKLEKDILKCLRNL